MSLAQLLELSSLKERKQGLSEQRLNAQINNLREQIAFYREYPDLFVDFMVWGKVNPTEEDRKEHPNNFKFYTYQRISKIVPLSGNRHSKCS